MKTAELEAAKTDFDAIELAEEFASSLSESQENGATSLKNSVTEFRYGASSQSDQSDKALRKALDLPRTDYKKHVVGCMKKENAFVFDFMSDYLTLMDVLAKAISRELSSACGITTLQYRIMLRLKNCEHAVAHGLSDELGIGASTISNAVSKLVDRGAVLRGEDADDMRTVFLSLSDHGKRLIDAADEAVLANMQSYWNSLTPEQLEAACKSVVFAASYHSYLRYEEGRFRFDTAMVDAIMFSRMSVSRTLQDRGLSTNDFRVMLALQVIGRSEAMGNVAQFLFLHSSDLTSSLNNLDARGFIARERLATNRRIKSVGLTDSGREELACMMPHVFDALHETCHSDDELIKLHISAARNLVARKRVRQDY